MNLPLIGIWIKLLSVPYRWLFPAIVLFCAIGVYSTNNNTWDIWMVAMFGVVGYIFIKLGMEPAPLLLGFILGPMMEENLRRAMLLSRGDWSVFVTRPLSASLLAVAVLLLIIVALPSISESLIRYFLETCDAHGIKTFIVPNYYQYTSTSFEINQIGLIPVINLRALPLDKSENKFLKRAFDIIFSSLFLLLIGSWLFPLLAILIKLNSKGPVFFKQERWGINNKKMNCYKFRTMYHQKAGESEFVQATKNDPRVTSVGKWLRSLSIDETPQFWNVLIDNMSVVGPRPHVTPQNLEYSEKIESYRLRHQVKPGLTGWAQVNGARGETPDIEHMQARVNYDLYYIHQWNFWLDIQIVLQTIVNVFKVDKHAY